jgi:hypothetical protein
MRFLAPTTFSLSIERAAAQDATIPLIVRRGALRRDAGGSTLIERDVPASAAGSLDEPPEPVASNVIEYTGVSE